MKKEEDHDDAKPEYTRDEYVYLAKLYGIANREKEMINAISWYIKLDPELTKPERVLFVESFDKVVQDKKKKWRLIFSLEKRELFRTAEINNANILKDIRIRLETEMKKVYERMHELLEKHILPKYPDKDENRLFYLKEWCDYYRHMTEISSYQEYKKLAEKTKKEYTLAWAAAKTLPMHSLTRLSLAVSFSAFFYEILNDREEAKKLAKFSFDECMKTLDQIEKHNSSETMMIIKILNENIMLWEIEEELPDTPESDAYIKRRAEEYRER